MTRLFGVFLSFLLASTFAFVSFVFTNKEISDIFTQPFALVVVHDTIGPCIYFYLNVL